MLKIPVTMATQHPDSASKYIPIQEEAEEALEAILPNDRGGLGIDEVMIDYEGKITPYQELMEVAFRAIDFGLILGKDVNITPRIPSGTREGIFRQMSILGGILEVNYKVNLEGHDNGIFEIIHPMTEKSIELIKLRENINNLSKLIFKEGGKYSNSSNISIIPLIESVPRLISIKEIISSFIDYNPHLIDNKERSMRVFLGFSDAALKYSMISSMLSNKIAISDINSLSKEMDLNIYPILGGGHLPFRGFISPHNKRNLIEEYAGVKTITIQSGIRYGSDKEKLLSFINYLKRELQFKKALSFSEEEKKEMLNIIGIASRPYIETLFQIVPQLSLVSEFIPSTRDRLTEFGKLGYSRETPQPLEIADICPDISIKKKLLNLGEITKISQPIPRAIRFTASLYIMGIPPEIIGLGRALNELNNYNESLMDNLLKKYFPSINEYISYAMNFVNLYTASKILPNKVIKDLNDDISYVKEYLKINSSINTDHEIITNMLTESFLYIYKTKKALNPAIKENIKNLILLSGKARESLG